MDKYPFIDYENESLRLKAEQLAKQLNGQIVRGKLPCLMVGEEKLALKMANFSLLSVDFSLKTWQKRKTEGKKQGLVRACKPADGLKIIDATAGWGRDSAILASFGAEVLLLERNPLMGALLADALERMNEMDRNHLNLSLLKEDALLYLNQLGEKDYPDIIYLDPMHPQRNKSALVKKEMQALQQLIGVDDDALSLLNLAKQKVKQKVVVKWPQKVAPLFPANQCIAGKTIRFDIYLADNLLK